MTSGRSARREGNGSDCFLSCTTDSMETGGRECKTRVKGGIRAKGGKEKADNQCVSFITSNKNQRLTGD